MSRFGWSIELKTGWPSGLGSVSAGRSKCPLPRIGHAAPGATGINLCRSLWGSAISATLPVLLVSLGAYSQSTGTSNLADVAAGPTAQDPVVLFLIGVGLATLGAIGLRRLAKTPSRVPAGRKGRSGEVPDPPSDSE